MTKALVDMHFLVTLVILMSINGEYK